MRHALIGDHARLEMARRQIPEEMVRGVAMAPEQVVSSRKGRAIHQSRVVDPISGRTMLLRVAVEARADTLLVVTAYKTSKVEKYWRQEPEP